MNDYDIESLNLNLTPKEIQTLGASIKAMVARGFPETLAQPMCLAQVRSGDPGGSGYHLLSTADGWTICIAGRNGPDAVFDDFGPALKRVCELGRDAKSLVYIHGVTGAVFDRYDYTNIRTPDGALHVRPGDSGWIVEIRGETPSVEAFATKREAIEHARPMAERMGVALVTHYADGAVQKRREAEASRVS